MKQSLTALLVSALLLTATAAMAATMHPFTPKDLVMMSRVNSPQLSPDGKLAAFTVRKTDFEANKGVTSVWTLELGRSGAKPQEIARGFAPRFSPDGKTLYFLASRSGKTVLFSVAAAGGKPLAVSDLPLSINNYELSPDGSHVLLSIDVFMDCKDDAIQCTRERLDKQSQSKATGRLYTHLLERHWDHWTNHRRGQLFLVGLTDDGTLGDHPTWLTK